MVIYILFTHHISETAVDVWRGMVRCVRGASSVYLYMQLVDVYGWVLLCVWEQFQVCRQVMGGMRRGLGASKGWGDQGVNA